MSIFPLITKERQALYEKFCFEHPEERKELPDICGYYGRACRRMGGMADRRLCTGCSFSKFASAIDAIMECCNEKESLGIENLYDSDIYSIVLALEEKGIGAGYTYIEEILGFLTGEEK